MAPTANRTPIPKLHDLDHELLHDDRLTAMGLLVETHAGIMSLVSRDLEDLGVQTSSFEVLLRLARSTDHQLRMSELAAQTSLTNSGLTRLVDRLVDAELVERRVCETDRRGYHATITRAGLDKLAGILPSHLRAIDRTLTGVLDPAELEAFTATLRKLRAVVNPDSDPERAALLAEP